MNGARAAVVWSANVPDSENTTPHQRAKVLSEQYDCDFYIFGDPDNINAQSFGNVSCIKRKGVISGLRFLLYVLYSVAIRGCLKYDIVHTSYHPLTSIIGFFCGTVGHKWVHDIWDHPILTVPDPSKDMSSTQIFVFVLKCITYKLSIYAISKADRVVLSLDPSIKNELQLSGTDVISIPNGTDLTIYDDIQPKYNSEFTAVYVGAIAKHRGADAMLRTAASASEQIDDFSMVLIGEVWNEEWLKKKINRYGIEENIRLTGMVPHHEALQMIADADVGLCLFPSSPETDYIYPIKLFEYMALETVSVCSNLRGISSVITDGESGYLVAPADGEEAAAAVIEAHENQTDDLTANALTKVQDYDWNELNRRFESAIEFN